MTKIIHRPDPPVDTNANNRVRNTSLIQNRDASARLFEQALVKVEGQRKSDFKTQDRSTARTTDQLKQIEKSTGAANAIEREEVLLSVLKTEGAEAVADIDLPLNVSLPEDELSTGRFDDSDETSLDATAAFFSPGIGLQNESGDFSDHTHEQQHHQLAVPSNSSTEVPPLVAGASGGVTNPDSEVHLLSNLSDVV